MYQRKETSLSMSNIMARMRGEEPILTPVQPVFAEADIRAARDVLDRLTRNSSICEVSRIDMLPIICRDY